MHIEKDIPFALHLQKWLMTGWLTFSRELGGAVMLDFRAAVIDHELLIGKAKSYGFTSTAIAWPEDYLTGWKQRFFSKAVLLTQRSYTVVCHTATPHCVIALVHYCSRYLLMICRYVQRMSILECMPRTTLFTVLIFCVMS